MSEKVDRIEIEQVIKAAGKETLEYWPGGEPTKELGKQEKSDGSIVTDGDFASNEIIINGLRGLYPDDGIFSEEGCDDSRLEASNIWVIDPVDGTSHFANGSDGYAILLARVFEQRSNFGVCYFPVQDIYIQGGNDEQSYNGNKLLTVSDRSELGKDSVFLKSIKSTKDEYYEDITVHPAFHFLKLCQGEIEGIIIKITNHKEWDLAPYIPILNGAGGVSTDERGQEPKFYCEKPQFKYLIGSNGKVHQKLLDLVEEDIARD